MIGVGIGLALACPILILATMNIITGLLATLTITIITVSVVGVIPMAGWKLGVRAALFHECSLPVYCLICHQASKEGMWHAGHTVCLS